MILMMKLPLLLILFISLSYSTFSQNPPNIERKDNQIVEITNLTGKISGRKCVQPSLLKGVVTKKWFEKDDLTIAGFIIKDAKDKEFSILLNNEQVKLLGLYSVDTMSSVIKNGKRLQVWSYECVGDSDTVLYASRIKIL